mmetsp:Transcript_6903/g.14385  ORF Transcript_6903/g.14385 Transcript_6903/m.14385 type:complete len:125 (+) Transcript_6903:31-405(+)
MLHCSICHWCDQLLRLEQSFSSTKSDSKEIALRICSTFYVVACHHDVNDGDNDIKSTGCGVDSDLVQYSATSWKLLNVRWWLDTNTTFLGNHQLPTRSHPSSTNPKPSLSDRKRTANRRVKRSG